MARGTSLVRFSSWGGPIPYLRFDQTHGRAVPRAPRRNPGNRPRSSLLGWSKFRRFIFGGFLQVVVISNIAISVALRRQRRPPRWWHAQNVAPGPYVAHALRFARGDLSFRPDVAIMPCIPDEARHCISELPFLIHDGRDDFPDGRHKIRLSAAQVPETAQHGHD